MKPPRILYLQFTNPGGYPPLHHSSRIFAQAGWEVLFLGTEAFGTRALTLPYHPRIQSRRLRFRAAGWGRRLQYVRFTLWAMAWSLRWRPRWIYASDPCSCPVALALSQLAGAKVIYHEHDTPWELGVRGSSVQGSRAKASCGFQEAGCGWAGEGHRLLLHARRRLAQRAAICILPNAERVERFRESTRRESGTRCIWNCPSREEALVEPDEECGAILHYHGNLGPELLPRTVIQALALVPGMALQVIGYATEGHQDYLKKLAAEAAESGVADRVRFEAAKPRWEVLSQARKARVGLTLMPMDSDNPNFQGMVGASNKPFDYLACGLPVLVNQSRDWGQAFVEPGYGVSCDPEDPSSIARALHWVMANPSSAASMGEMGRQRILCAWNYERLFAPVLEEIESNHRE